MPPDYDRYLPIRRPYQAANALAQVAIPQDAEPGDKLQLVLRLNDSEVNLAELAAFLSFVDRSYGRLDPKGLRSYSRSRHAQAHVDFQAGSLEIIFESILEEGDRLVVLWMILKYAPSGLKSLTSGYREYEEARLARTRRKQIREEMKADEKIAQLEQKRINQLAQFLDEVYIREQRTASRVRRFTLRYLQDVFFRVNR